MKHQQHAGQLATVPNASSTCRSVRRWSKQTCGRPQTKKSSEFRGGRISCGGRGFRSAAPVDLHPPTPVTARTGRVGGRGVGYRKNPCTNSRRADGAGGCGLAGPDAQISGPPPPPAAPRGCQVLPADLSRTTHELTDVSGHGSVRTVCVAMSWLSGSRVGKVLDIHARRVRQGSADPHHWLAAVPRMRINI